MDPFTKFYIMLRTNLVSDLADIPREWVFENYLDLSESLTGQDVKIKSVFNTEKTPSMCIYYDSVKSVYKYKDFSSGNGGDGLDLVRRMFNLSTRGEASFKIIEDYNEYLLTNDKKAIKTFKSHGRYQVTDYMIRHWTNIDQKYWSKYKIGSRLLEAYNVAPLEYYKMSRENLDGSCSRIKINGLSIYGYFKEDGTLYKIYQPKVSNKKFIKVKNYVQGSEQLTGNKDYLVITSSLKDLMTFQKLNIVNVECIAPDSENTLIRQSYIDKVKEQYKNICVLFDNDEAGKKAAQKYADKYSIMNINLELEKDLSDSIKIYGIEHVRDVILPLLKEKLKS